jgi:hypothetical protein
MAIVSKQYKKHPLRDDLKADSLEQTLYLPALSTRHASEPVFKNAMFYKKKEEKQAKLNA